MPAYEHETATTEQAQSYAECVRLIHPNEMTSGSVIAIKVIIVCAILGAAFGVWKGRQDFCTGWALGGFMGLIGGGLLPIAIAIAFMAITFLFT